MSGFASFHPTLYLNRSMNFQVKSITITYVLNFFFLICIAPCSWATPNVPPYPSIILPEENKGSANTLSLESDIDQVAIDLQNPLKFNSKTCPLFIDSVTGFLLEKGPREYIPRTNNEINFLKENGLQILNKLFLIRLELRNKLKDLYLKGEATPECVQRIRKANRYSRFMEEFLGEWLAEHNLVELVSRDHEKNDYQLFVNPKYKNYELESGDILLARGESFVSATIARIGDDDGQFSHAAIVYVNSKGTKFVVEALIERGLVITPLNEWREAGHARSVVFRHPDRALAKKAGEMIYQKATKALESNAPIPYDFKMDMSNAEELFCSEVVRNAYELASNGEYILPTYSTSFEGFRGHSFLKNMGITVPGTFGPSDLEIEPTIELVAEWRNLRKKKKIRSQDVILTSMLQWIVEQNYELKYSFSTSFKASFGKISSWLGFKKVPQNMSYGFLKTLIALDKLNSKMEKYLIIYENEYFYKYKYSLSYKEAMDLMEELRREDCSLYKARLSDALAQGSNGKKIQTTPFFHLEFNAGGMCFD